MPSRPVNALTIPLWKAISWALAASFMLSAIIGALVYLGVRADTADKIRAESVSRDVGIARSSCESTVGARADVRLALTKAQMVAVANPATIAAIEEILTNLPALRCVPVPGPTFYKPVPK